MTAPECRCRWRRSWLTEALGVRPRFSMRRDGDRAMDFNYDHLSEQAVIQLQKLEYDHLLASKGLNGTLYGAWASLFAIIVLIFAPMVTERDIVTGWQLVAIVGFLAGAVVFYGAFIFNRALRITAERTRDGASLAADTQDRRAPRNDR
jgi:hypothetical protein